MKTYLDTYAYRLQNENAITVSFDSDDIETHEMKRTKSQTDSASNLRHQALGSAHILTNKPSWVNADIEETARFRCLIAPFVIETMNRPLAASLDRDLVADFRGQVVEGPIRAVGLDVISDHGVTYIDLPHRSYMIGNTLQLRALFIYLTPDAIAFTAILTTPGMDYGRRVTWAEGQWARGLPGLAGDELTWSSGNDSTRIGGDEIETYLTAVDDRKTVFTEIEHFAWLALTYVQTEQEDGVVWERLPHIPHSDPRWSGRKASQVAKKFSLFSVIQVNAQNLYRDAETEGRGGSLPGHRKRKHRVRGHFRLQAYGPRWSKRRLRWYPAHYSGTIDLPAPVPLYKLRGHHLEEMAA